MKTKRSPLDRQTYVDRGNGIISLIRPAPVKITGIYDKPATDRFSDDRQLRASIDNAWVYLENKGYDKRASTADLMKVAFAAGVFVGMTILAVICYSIGVL